MDFNSPRRFWRVLYRPCLCAVQRRDDVVVLVMFLATAASGIRLLDAMQPRAYGIFLMHYIFIIWLQYAIYDYSWPAFIKFAIVLGGTLALSWAVTVLLRKIPVVVRTI
jgi:surface polysaccharide O-acyltransferase-like enzyme